VVDWGGWGGCVGWGVGGAEAGRVKAGAGERLQNKQEKKRDCVCM